MRTTRPGAGPVVAAATAGLLTTAGAGTAAAHVTAQPEQAAKGDSAKIAFRVPDERPRASTVRVHVALPLEHPLSSVRTKPLPGWTARVDKVHLDQPVTVDGAQVSDAVSGITWTAEPGSRIGPDQFQEFEATLSTLPPETDALVMPTDQTYDNGEVVSWDAPPQAPGQPEPEHPAPNLRLVDGGGHAHSTPQAGGTRSGGEQPTSDQPGSDHADGTARWLGGAGLLVGALGLGIGIGSLLRSRRSKA